jgi:hypothetical protein
MEAHRVVRRRGSHIFYTIGSEMPVRSALCAGRLLAPGRFLVLISVTGRVYPRATMRLVGLGKLKKSNDFFGNRTRGLLACSIVPQPTTVSRASHSLLEKAKKLPTSHSKPQQGVDCNRQLITCVTPFLHQHTGNFLYKV